VSNPRQEVCEVDRPSCAARSAAKMLAKRRTLGSPFTQEAPGLRCDALLYLPEFDRKDFIRFLAFSGWRSGGEPSLLILPNLVRFCS
jgi:hypothetical protein